MKIKITSVVYKTSKGVVGLGNTLLRTWVLPHSPCQLLSFLKKSVKKPVKLRHSAKWLRTGTSRAVATSALLYKTNLNYTNSKLYKSNTRSVRRVPTPFTTTEKTVRGFRKLILYSLSE